MFLKVHKTFKLVGLLVGHEATGLKIGYQASSGPNLGH